jgi:hypothetical protein
MNYHFSVEQTASGVKINKISNFPFYSYALFVDHWHVGTFFNAPPFYLDLKPFSPGKHLLTLIAYHAVAERPFCIVGKFPFYVQGAGAVGNESTTLAEERNREFRSGDILVASDNVNELMTGYMGHTAIVIDQNSLIESPGGYPAIRQDNIQQFLRLHPNHAQFRPKSAEMGEKAAQYASSYLNKYRENLASGIESPIFSISFGPLDDPWTDIYCSKLIWLSYYYGADYKFKNDYLWFSPEDLYTQLSEDRHFEEIYKHPDFEFKLNT